MTDLPWKKYEEVASELLYRFRKDLGFTSICGKMKIKGKFSGTTWEVDILAKKCDGNFIYIECKRYPDRRINQETVASIYFKVIDTGAVSAITISPNPRQKGANKVGAAANVEHIQLNADANPSEYILKTAEKFYIGRKDDVGISIKERITITKIDRDIPES